MYDFFVSDNVILLSIISVSLVFSFILTPFIKETARRMGVIDVPRDNRRMHKDAVPLMGGAAMIISFILTALLFFKSYYEPVSNNVIFVAAGVLLCGVFGLLDDALALNPFYKLGFQTLLSAFSAFFISRIEAFTLFGRVFSLGALSFPVTVFWILFMMNAINLTDGMDGLASGVSAISAFSLSVLLFIYGERDFSLLAVCVCGACLGFLLYNSNPASVFMGETGSAFLGFILSTISTRLFSSPNPSPMSTVFLLFILPISETVSSFFRRIFSGKNPLLPDKKHIHHLLYNRGFSVRKICIILYTFAAASSFSAVIYPEYGTLSALIFAASIVFIRLSLDSEKKIYDRHIR